MGKDHKKQVLFTILTAIVFLSTIPAVSNSSLANAITGSSSGTVMKFPEGTTVLLLSQILIPKGNNWILRVKKAGGTDRTKGQIEAGDTIFVLNRSGRILSRCTVELENSSASGTVSRPQSSPSKIPESSSQPPDSSKPSSNPETSSSPSSFSSGISSSSAKPVHLDECTIFQNPVTVETFKKQLESEYGTDDYGLKIKSASRTLRDSGNLCTGDTITIYDNSGGQIDQTTVIILGDLTRCGICTERSSDLLYEYLIHKSDLKEDAQIAADLNQDGTVNTVDLLLLKKKLANSE